MISDKYSNVSIVGRVAYGIMCVETYLMNKYPKRKWEILVKKLWEITNLQLWDKWMDEVIEIIPEYLFEFPDYTSSDFEYLSQERYDELVNLYEGTGNDINEILKLFYELSNAHAYSAINGSGSESLEILEKIIQFLMINSIELPLDAEIMEHKFEEKNGWGNAFDGKQLSIILN